MLLIYVIIKNDKKQHLNTKIDTIYTYKYIHIYV